MTTTPQILPFSFDVKPKRNTTTVRIGYTLYSFTSHSEAEKFATMFGVLETIQTH